MQKAIDVIQNYAHEFKKLEQSDQYLFDFLNSKPKSEIEGLINDFGFVRTDFSASRFQPVNLLRFDILHLLKEGVQINSETVEDVKNKITEKDDEYFSKYGETLVNALKSYPKKKKSPFVNWQKNYCVFLPFFYTNSIKNATSAALDKILIELEKTWL